RPFSFPYKTVVGSLDCDLGDFPKKIIAQTRQGFTIHEQGAPAMSEKFFPSTEWTALIQIIQTGNSDEAWEGIARFCERYREPIKTYCQTLCRNPERAEDLTQDFIHVRVLKKNGGFIL